VEETPQSPWLPPKPSSLNRGRRRSQVLPPCHSRSVPGDAGLYAFAPVQDRTSLRRAGCCAGRGQRSDYAPGPQSSHDRSVPDVKPEPVSILATFLIAWQQARTRPRNLLYWLRILSPSSATLRRVRPVVGRTDRSIACPLPRPGRSRRSPPGTRASDRRALQPSRCHPRYLSGGL